ncbi:T9SS type A sorting domain-containing protein [Parapedobacter soli]|uniref:T9SS type A sorting domain-containing protein n=1 Tax=Parapedobacter soli TaxID=416955 RepID=UPI0021C85711|nr:T9SS type A sorting domain-containing protein [Parapedobacter soli]
MFQKREFSFVYFPDLLLIWEQEDDPASGASKDGKTQFETAGLPEGTYFVHIHKDGEVEKRQVVIRH